MSGLASLIAAFLTFVFQFAVNERLWEWIYSGRRLQWLGVILFDTDHAMLLALAVGALVFAVVQFVLYWKPVGLAFSLLGGVLSLYLVRQLPPVQVDPLTSIKLFVTITSGLAMLTWAISLTPWRNHQITEALEHELDSA